MKKENQIYFKIIKKALKAKNIDYRDLAHLLNMSESGVKKLLNAKDLSLGRITQLCQVIGVLPSQLLRAAEEQAVVTKPLTPQQEKALLGNQTLLNVYWLFAIDNRSIEQIALNQKIPAHTILTLLRRLVTLDLLVERKGTFLPNHPSGFRWPDSSPLARRLNEEWSRITLKRAIQSGTKNGFRLVTAKLTAESYIQLQQRLSHLFDEFIRISEREKLSHHQSELKHTSALFATIDKGFLDED